MQVFENGKRQYDMLTLDVHQIHPIAKVYGSKIVRPVIQSPSVYDLKASER